MSSRKSLVRQLVERLAEKRVQNTRGEYTLYLSQVSMVDRQSAQESINPQLTAMSRCAMSQEQPSLMSDNADARAESQAVRHETRDTRHETLYEMLDTPF